jgi:hypothetical protein
MKYEIAPKSTEIESNWFDAKLYCFSLNIDGKTGWRLPTKEELNEIYQSENDCEDSWYWSAIEYNGINAWGQSVFNGSQRYYSKNYRFYVRAIRELKDN